ncbi:MAG: MaoC family dehydratase [Cyclobacteriaceae bacterium]
MMKVGDQYQTDFVITQEMVNEFAELSGDKNPLHLDAEFAAQTPFKQPIVHGIFSVSIISKIMGTEFPGAGSVYLDQQFQFKRPVYPGKEYYAKIVLISVEEGKHRGVFSTQIFSKDRNKVAVDGQATVLHMEKLP